MGKLCDRDILAGADVERRSSGIPFENRYAGICKVIDVDEFAFRRPRSPYCHGWCCGDLCFMKAPNEGRDDVGILRMIIVTRAEHIVRITEMKSAPYWRR